MVQRGLISALLASATLLAASPAQAVDFPMLKGSQMDLPPAAELEQPSRPLDWSGFYIGGHGGLTQSRFLTANSVGDLANQTLVGGTAINDYTPSLLVVANARTDSGPGFGVMAGYNMLFGSVMAGVELDWTHVNQKSQATTYQARSANGTGLIISSVQNATINDYATARIRLGWVVDNVMPYVTAGVAVGQFDTNVSVTSNWIANTTTMQSALGYPRTIGGSKKGVWGYGMSLGGGVDVALAENIFLRGEYLYTRFNDVNGVTIGLNTARVAAGVKF